MLFFVAVAVGSLIAAKADVINLYHLLSGQAQATGCASLHPPTRPNRSRVKVPCLSKVNLTKAIVFVSEIILSSEKTDTLPFRLLDISS